MFEPRQHQTALVESLVFNKNFVYFISAELFFPDLTIAISKLIVAV